MNLHGCSSTRTKKGYALVLLAVLMAIVGLFLEVSSKTAPEIDLPKVADTRINLTKIKNALEIYKSENGSYPCPASRVALESDGAFGVATTCTAPTPATCNLKTGIACSGNVAIGVVPTRALNIPDDIGFDEWGNRINYAVDMSGSRGITIQNVAAASDTNKYFLYSSGPNARGAYNRTGKVAIACGTPSGPPYDPENCNDNANFVSDSWKLASDGRSYDYDDLTTSPPASPTPCPANVSGCTWWLAANDIDGDDLCLPGSENDLGTSCDENNGGTADDNEPADGATIATWVDKSLNGHDATRVVGNPVLDYDAVNGMPAVIFNNSEAFNITSDQWGTEYTFSFVYNAEDDVNNVFVLHSWHLASFTTFSTNGVYMVGRGDNNGYLPKAYAAIDSTWSIITIRREEGTGTTKIFADGLLVYSNENPYGLINIGNAEMDIGATVPYVNANTSLKGGIAEVSYYNKALDEASYQEIECYLADKYDIKVSHCNDPCSDFVFVSACPADVAGCQIWYRSDEIASFRKADNSSVTTDGDGVYAWCDVSGNNNNAQVHGAAIYDEDGMGTGYPSIQTADVLNTSTGAVVAPWVDPSAGYTALITFRIGDFNAQQYILEGAGAYLNLGVWHSALKLLTSRFIGAVNYLPNNSAISGDKHVAAIRYNPSTTTADVFLDGRIVVSQTLTVSSANTKAANSKAANALASNWLGDLSEYAYYSSALSNVDIQAISEEMATRWQVNNPAAATCPPATGCPYGTTDCQFWFDAEHASTLKKPVTESYAPASSDNDEVGVWCDKSPSANHAVANGAPYLVENGINSNNAIQFDETANAMITQGDSDMVSSGKANYSIFVVGKGTAITNSSSWVGPYLHAIGTHSSAYFYNSIQNSFCYVHLTDPTICAPTAPGSGYVLGTPFIIGMSFDDDNNERRMFVNGATRSDVTYATNISAPNQINLTGAWGVGNNIDGQMGEVVVYNKELTDTDRAIVTCGLADKWDLCDDIGTAMPNYCDGVGDDLYCVGTDAN